ncbi:MAG: hypothetical protein ACLT1J_13580 [Mediterraneibacter gnavus]
MRLYVNFDSTNALNSFTEQCKQDDITVNDAQITKLKGEDHSEVIAMLAVKSRIKMDRSGMIACFAKYWMELSISKKYRGFYFF